MMNAACRIESTWFLASLLIHGELLLEEISSSLLAPAAFEEKKK
jgi:hypothetical protein